MFQLTHPTCLYVLGTCALVLSVLNLNAVLYREFDPNPAGRKIYSAYIDSL